jgi:hypothetical protein
LALPGQSIQFQNSICLRVTDPQNQIELRLVIVNVGIKSEFFQRLDKFTGFSLQE